METYSQKYLKQGERKMTNTLLTEDKSIVVPGEELAEGIEFLPGSGTYRLKSKILSSE